jgi:hypothetical protein
MEIVDCLIDYRIDAKLTKLPTDLIAFDYRGNDFIRYPIPMVVVDGEREKLLWNHLVPVSIAETPKLLISNELLQKRSNLTSDEWEKLFKFISINHALLLDQWNCQIEDKYGVDWDAVNKLLRVE